MKLVKYKPTGLVFKVKRVRKSGKVELESGVVVSNQEFKLNWIILE